MKVFVDTSALYALLDRDDENHEKARITRGEFLYLLHGGPAPAYGLSRWLRLRPHSPLFHVLNASVMKDTSRASLTSTSFEMTFSSSKNVARYPSLL